MKKNFWTNGLLAAGILAALSTGSVFAAAPEEDAAIQQQGQSYNQKIEQGAETLPEQKAVQTETGFTRQSGKIKSKESREFHRQDEMRDKPHRDEFRGSRHDNDRTPHDGEFRGKHRDDERDPRDGEFREKHRDDERGPRDGEFREKHRDDKRGPRDTGKLTEDQRKQLAAEREQFFANWNNMTEEQRHAATERFIARTNEEKMKNMSEDEKKSFVKQQAERQAEREKIAKMSEDERHAYFQKKHDRMVKERTKNMSKEEKTRFLEREKHRQERMDEFWKKWKAMTPAEKEQWRKEHPRRAFAPMPKGSGMERPATAAEK